MCCICKLADQVRTRSCRQHEGPDAAMTSAMLLAQLIGSAPRLSGDSGAHAACKYDASSPARVHCNEQTAQQHMQLWQSA